MENNAEKERNNEIVEQQENREEKPVEKGKVKDILSKLKESGESAVKWVEKNTPVALEKVGEAADIVKDAAETAADWADANAKKAKNWIEAQSDAKKLRQMEYDLKTLRPIFDEDIPQNYNQYPILNIIESDEIRKDNPVCQGSYGFKTEARDIDVINIYLSSFDHFRVKINSSVEEGIYFANPYIPGEYIESNQYAAYLKDERVRELFRIADCLGAKYVSVSFTMVEKKVEEEKGKLSLKKGKDKAEMEAERKLSESLQLSIEHSSHFKPHNNPVRPELIYYKDNNTIKDLIDRRMRNSLVSDTYSIMYSSASGARIKEATKIDGAIKALKLGAAQSLSVCYSVESRIRMSYRIEFDN